MCVNNVDMIRHVYNTWDEPEKITRYVDNLEKFDILNCDTCKTLLYRLMFTSNKIVLAAMLLPLTESIFKEALNKYLKDWQLDVAWETLEYGKGLYVADLGYIEKEVQTRTKK